MSDEPKFKVGSAWTGDWRESLVVRDSEPQFAGELKAPTGDVMRDLARVAKAAELGSLVVREGGE